MKGITIGIGNGWDIAAKRSAAQMHKMTGIECDVITENFANVHHPSWLKVRLLERYPKEDSLLVFDADLICLKPWSPEDELGVSCIAAVRDDENAQVLGECKTYDIPKDKYFNAGLLIFDRRIKTIFDSVWGHFPSYGRYYEQTGISAELYRQNVPVKILDRKFNRLLKGDFTKLKEIQESDCVNLHIDSLEGSFEHLLEAMDDLGIEK